MGSEDRIDVTVNFTDSDRMRHLIMLNDTNLPIRRFKVYTKNNLKDVYLRY